MEHLKIRYKSHEGVLNTSTYEVYFYHFKYSNIHEAIKNIETDYEAHKDELVIFDNLMKDLIID